MTTFFDRFDNVTIILLFSCLQSMMDWIFLAHLPILLLLPRFKSVYPNRWKTFPWVQSMEHGAVKLGKLSSNETFKQVNYLKVTLRELS